MPEHRPFWLACPRCDGQAPRADGAQTELCRPCLEAERDTLKQQLAGVRRVLREECYCDPDEPQGGECVPCIALARIAGESKSTPPSWEPGTCRFCGRKANCKTGTICWDCSKVEHGDG